MSILKVSRMGHPVLRKKAKALDRATVRTPAIQKLIDDMMETMCDVNGAGLAAIQVGASERIFIIDAVAAGGDKTDPPKAYINPVFEFLSPETDVQEEGCLSFPGIFVPVKRSLSARMRALDIDGNEVIIEAEHFFARALQHEYDHLENKLLFDHAGAIKRQMIKRKLDRMTDDEAMDLLRNVGE